MPQDRRRFNSDDIAFASYLGAVTTTLIAGALFVLVLDIEGETKLAASLAFLLPATALAAVIVYAMRNPLRRRSELEGARQEVRAQRVEAVEPH